MTGVKQAVILAGGIGKRLRPLTNSIPKPMAPVNSRPFLEYLIEMLKNNGITEVVLLLGYLSEKIVEHFGDGSDYGIDIKYSIGEVERETGKRINMAKYLLDDKFLLMYSDNYYPLNLKKLLEFNENHNTQMTVTVYSNKDGITKNNMLVGDDGLVIKYDKSRTDPNLNGVEIGFFIVDKDVIDLMPDENFSFEKVIIPKLIENKQLSGYLTDHRYYSIGDLDRLRITERFLQERKVIFLDRDGVINKKAPKADYVKKWEEFEFLPGALEAITFLTEKGYEIFIITNQAGIARNMMTEEDLDDIHTKMIEEIGRNNGKILKIYYCPHGWDEGCECRKPRPGMFHQAAREHLLNLTKTYFIGDDERDLEAGEAADCKTYLVSQNENLLDVVENLIE